jgi:multidrug efflux system membrane fusion protein
VSKSSLIIITAALALQACRAPEAERPLPPRTVLVTPVKTPNAPVDTVAGTVRSSRLAIVASEQGGRVVELLADVGTRVAAGQPLARLDPAPASLRARQAAAELARAEAVAAERGRNAARVRALQGDKVASDADLEQAEGDARSAEAAREAAAAALALARREAAHAVLRAPSSGVVASRPAVLAAVLAPGAPAFEIEGDGERRIQALVPAGVADRLNRAGPVRFRYDGLVGEARLMGLSARDNGAGGREATFAVVSGTPAPGAQVELLLASGVSSAKASVPLAAVLKGRDGGETVRIVGADKRLRDIPVTLLSVRGASAQVSGPLAAGQLVVAAGGEFLEAGMAVRPHLAQR